MIFDVFEQNLGKHINCSKKLLNDHARGQKVGKSYIDRACPSRQNSGKFND